MVVAQSRASEGCDGTPMNGDTVNNSQGNDDDDRNLNKVVLLLMIRSL